MIKPEPVLKADECELTLCIKPELVLEGEEQTLT